jgi:uncharacterized protein (DUF58 family)
MVPSTEIQTQARYLQLRLPERFSRLLQGQARSRRGGEGIDFRDLREFTPGDDARRIDALSTARIGEPVIRTYNEDRRVEVIILVDDNTRMQFGSGMQTKKDLLLEVLSLLLLGFSGRLYRTSVWSDDLRQVLRPSRSNVLHFLHKYGSAPPSRPVSLEANMIKLARSLHQPTAIVILSDFLTPVEPAACQALTGHRLFPVRLLDPVEEHLLETARSGDRNQLDGLREMVSGRVMPGRLFCPEDQEELESWLDTNLSLTLNPDWNPAAVVEWLRT